MNKIDSIIKEFHKKFTKQVDTESRYVIADPKEVDSFLRSSLEAVERQTREDLMRNLNNYNVSVCFKCKSIFKAVHSNCKSLSNKTETEKEIE